jgi:polysaccharide biosynthesis transport protein
LKSNQFSIHEIISIVRRRRKLIFSPTIIVTILCVIGAYLLPRKYESSTTILVRRDEVLNPLVNYTMAVALTQEDPLSTFNEIIFSRSTIQTLIDSLGVGISITTEIERQALIKAIQENIDIERKRGSESFSITYVDTDPVRAQRAASSLANIFIQTSQQVENQRNDLAVQFFERKLEEYRQKFESSQKEVVSVLQQRISDLPAESRSMYIQVEGYDRQINDIDTRIKTLQEQLTILRTFPEAVKTDIGKQNLYNLQRVELPFVDELRTLLAKYDQFVQRYTAKYPEVEKIEMQIIELLDRMRRGVDVEITKQQSQRWDLEKRKTQLVDDIKRSSVTQRVDQDKESNYGIFRNLYDEMKVKLEQARTNRDLGSKNSNQFVIIDPAIVPTLPTKPSRSLIVMGGFIVGLLLGILSIFIAEIIDTTIRTAQDVAVYQKPVIAFIPEGHDDIEKY